MRTSVAAGLSLLAACASAPPSAPGNAAARSDTSHGAVDRGDVVHVSLALGQVSSGGLPRERPAPSYPPALLPAHLPPVAVGARLFVDAQGRVSEVRIEDDGLEDAHRRAFEAAVRDAAMAWTFDPLVVAQWAADANGTSHLVGTEARPFSLDYVFRFAWRDGRPVTDVDAMTAGRPP